MRELKFRAWDKDSKHIYFNFSVVSHGEFNAFYLSESVKSYTEDYVLMQFTGLLDKNGVAIYEGDIVTDCEYVGEVVFHDRRFEVGDHSGLLAWAIKNKKTGEWITLGDSNNEYTWEIIGNAFENKELLDAS